MPIGLGISRTTEGTTEQREKLQEVQNELMLVLRSHKLTAQEAATVLSACNYEIDEIISQHSF